MIKPLFSVGQIINIGYKKPCVIGKIEWNPFAVDKDSVHYKEPFWSTFYYGMAGKNSDTMYREDFVMVLILNNNKLFYNGN